MNCIRCGSVPNKYVDFVSDSHFKKCVKIVCDTYNSQIRDDKKLQKNGIDAIKMTFDMKLRGLDFQKWKSVESDRQNDKTVSNAIGDFHQNLLGKVKGWKNLGKGHESGLDLKKNDNSIFMELKNKDNDINGNVEATLRRKMMTQHQKTPNATIYFAYICAKNKKSEEKDWTPRTDEKKKMHHKNIRRISGSKVYELITGKEDALEQVWKALPLAIKDLYGIDNTLSDIDQKEFKKWFDYSV